MTLRQLWLMSAGRMERQRELIVSQRWAIGSLFGGKVGQSEIESFIQYGIAAKGTVEQFSPSVHEKVARSLREGKVVFD